ncbi:GNAT family N-acetyltransferase [Arthrobacter sp. S41]|uniref:GNAT family N-acetyltransferase n=1 Tax=Arthrobacter sp. S41 TaxID=2509721 RepID=UPI001F5F84CB|nr:GNAT family N-acetyltransferase [Arthrobacter sp. S41]
MGKTNSADIQIAQMTQDHWESVSTIYGQGITTGLATFESEVPSKEKFFGAKIPELTLVALDPEGNVAGWAAAAPISERSAYRGVVEHSVYIDPQCSGRGIGTILLQELIKRANEQGYWTIQSAIISGNEGSRSLHKKVGFREVGRRERIAKGACGEVAGQWMDTYLYELRL